MIKSIVTLTNCFIVTLVMAISVYGNSQDRAHIDSIFSQLNQPIPDTIKIESYLNLAKAYMQYDLDSAIIYAEKGKELSIKTNDDEWLGGCYYWLEYLYINNDNFERSIAYSMIRLKLVKTFKYPQDVVDCYNSIAMAYHTEGDIVNTIKYLNEFLDYMREIDFKSGMSAALNTYGYILHENGEIEKSLTYFIKSLKNDEVIGNKEGMSISLNNIGYIYKTQSDYENALKYFYQSIELDEEVGNEQGKASAYNNIGLINQKLEKYDEAQKYYNLSLEIHQKFKDKKGESMALNNIGVLLDDQKQYEEALSYYMNSLQLYEQRYDEKGIAISCANISRVYFELGNASQSIKFGERGFEIAQKLGYPSEIASSAKLLWKSYEEIGNIKGALDMHVLYIKMRDSLDNTETQKATLKQQKNYDHEKEMLKIEATQAKKDAKAKYQQEKQKIVSYSLGVGLLLILIITFIVYRGFLAKKKAHKLIKKQKLEVEHQRDLINEKNKEIIDSINYAKQIQEAILPADSVIREHLKESFILYLPKAIIAGDFYWLEVVGDNVYFSAADCTGHGVPGAMVSVMCSNVLSRCVTELNITSPAKILDHAVLLLEKRFKNSKTEVADGMDLALCCWNKKTNELAYAGAHNPLWIVRKDKVEVESTKPDKQPVGKYFARKPFTNHIIQLNSGDCIYLFTDGYIDQFGGERGKKLKSKAFKSLIMSIQDKSLREQKEILNDHFDVWKGDLEQIDDICIIGVKV